MSPPKQRLSDPPTFSNPLIIASFRGIDGERHRCRGRRHWRVPWAGWSVPSWSDPSEFVAKLDEQFAESARPEEAIWHVAR